MEPDNESLTLRDVLFILKKHLKLILIMMVLCGILGFIVSKFIIPPKYEATATLIVNPAKNAQTTITYDQISATQELVGTYSVIMKSDTVLGQVIRDLNLDTDVKHLAQNITVEGVNQTEVIQISVKDKNSQVATQIGNDIIKVAPDVIIRTVKAGSVEIISPARSDGKPVSPNIPLVTIIAFLAGFAIGVIAALIMEMMNNTFSSDEDVQKYLGFTVLGVIPAYETKKQS